MSELRLFCSCLEERQDSSQGTGERWLTDREGRAVCRRRDVILGVIVRAIEGEEQSLDLARFDTGCVCLRGWGCSSQAEDGGKEGECEFHLDGIEFEFVWMGFCVCDVCVGARLGGCDI